MFVAVWKRQFVFWGIDALSPLIHRHLANKEDGSCAWNYHYDTRASIREAATPSVTDTCVINLCEIVHQGGEGILFRGSCQNNGPVLYKWTKISNLQTAYHEAAATRVLQSQPASVVELIHHGVNYLVLAELVDYRHHRGRLNPDTLQEYMEQVLSQLKWLHQGGYFHLDVKTSNVLQRQQLASNSSQSLNKFQLIDTSGSQPTSEWKAMLHDLFHKHHRTRIPRLPTMVCMLPRQSRQERRYCQTRHNSTAAADQDDDICPGFVDAYMLGVHVLREWYMHVFHTPIERVPKLDHFEAIVRQHEIHVEALRRLKHTHDDASSVPNVYPAIRLLSQLVDRLNATLVCQDANGI
jgi:hypothetical protein